MPDALAYVIDGTALRNPTRWITDGSQALSIPTYRGEDIAFSGVVGEEPLPRVAGPTFDEVVVTVTGSYTAAGVKAADPIVQFQTNLRALQQLLDPAELLTVTKTELTPTGSTVYTSAQVRQVGTLMPRMQTRWIGEVLVRFKVYKGWTVA